MNFNKLEKRKRVLVISPHPDDETLALGGTIAKLISQGHEVYILTVAGHLNVINNLNVTGTLNVTGSMNFLG